VNCKVTDNLARAHWEKLVWNIPFNGLGVASAAGYEALDVRRAECQVSGPVGACLSTDKLLADARWENLVRDLMLEVIRTGVALGYPIPETLADKQIERTRSMGAYKASTLLDFERGQPLELEGLFLEPLRQARQAGLEVPRLERMCRVLQQLDPRGA
jgi:2-dehydropantoate 2-reductase